MAAATRVLSTFCVAVRGKWAPPDEPAPNLLIVGERLVGALDRRVGARRSGAGIMTASGSVPCSPSTAITQLVRTSG